MMYQYRYNNNNNNYNKVNILFFIICLVAAYF